MKQATVKELIKKAVIKLLAREKIIDVTVTDLIKEAGIARASFYRVYSNIDQVLDDIVSELRENFRDGMLPALLNKDINEIRSRTINYLYFIKERKVVLFNILPENASVIIAKIESMGVFNKDIFNEESIESNYIPPLVFVVITTIIKTWEGRNFKETPEELSDLILDIIGRKYLSL